MNERSDISRVLRHWFDDGPSTMPDRVVDVVADRIARQRQRPARRLPWRHLDMNLTIKIGAAIAAVLVIAVIGWNLLPGRSTGIGPPTENPTARPSSTAPAPSMALLTPPASSWWQGSDSCGECAGYLAAGAHTTRQLQPALMFTVPDGWINIYDAVDGIALIPNTDANRLHDQTGSATLHDLTVARNVAAGSTDCTDSSETGVGTTAIDIANALASRPGLVTSEPIAVSVGGLSGQQIDIAMAGDWTTPCPGEDVPQVALINFPQPGQSHFGVGSGERLRFILLDVPAANGGGTLLVDVYAAQPDMFAPHLAAAMTIVETFEFDLRP